MPVAAAAALMLALAPPAAAQHASENVVSSAQDAFGTSIGNESIGLYTQTDARGFSPKDAGNVRIEGLYFDTKIPFDSVTSILMRSTTMRVGLSAQSYPFPAPTGIADMRLKLPGKDTLGIFNAQYGPFSSVIGRMDVELPAEGRKPGFVFGVAAANEASTVPARFSHVEGSGILHWKLGDTFEVIAFLEHTHVWDGENFPFFFTGGAYAPPKIDRDIYASSSFHQGRTRVQWNVGGIVRGMVSDTWRLQAGLFRSTDRLYHDYSLLYLNTQPSGIADLTIRQRPPSQLASYSGEIRLSGLFREGEQRHTVHFSARGRAGHRFYGGDQASPYGPVDIGTRISIPKPIPNVGPLSEDSLRHGSIGIAYVGLWPGVGELGGGLQKAFYRRTLATPLRPRETTRANPWLYYGTLAVEAGKKLTFYAGFTRGLEDTVVAPENAVNAGEAPPASLTRQIDAGLRYRISKSMSLVAGVFEVKKPYFDRDAAAVYTHVGTLSHRGIELSLSGEPIEGLKIVTGAVLLKARVSGLTVTQGLIGNVPPGRLPVVGRLNATYGPPCWHGFSINGQVKVEGSNYANRLNTFRVPTLTTVDLGMRYDFKIQHTTASARFDVQNVTDEYVWTVNAVGGYFQPSTARRYIVRLAAEF